MIYLRAPPAHNQTEGGRALMSRRGRVVNSSSNRSFLPLSLALSSRFRLFTRVTPALACMQTYAKLAPERRMLLHWTIPLKASLPRVRSLFFRLPLFSQHFFFCLFSAPYIASASLYLAFLSFACARTPCFAFTHGFPSFSLSLSHYLSHYR